MTRYCSFGIKGSGEPYEAKGMPSLCEEFVASNALSIVQSVYEDEWIIKAIEHDGELIGFTMYGWNEDEGFYELCRIMIKREEQSKGYGTQAICLKPAELNFSSSAGFFCFWEYDIIRDDDRKGALRSNFLKFFTMNNCQD